MFGSFSRVTFGEEEAPHRLMELFRERFARFSMPVIAGLPVGHRLPNVPLPIGVLATWDDGRRVLRFDEEVVI
jgi:muramoyltetrapeptide carboxypeptidase LdcA involved in peptidoglycan recycling